MGTLAHLTAELYDAGHHRRLVSVACAWYVLRDLPDAVVMSPFPNTASNFFHIFPGGSNTGCTYVMFTSTRSEYYSDRVIRSHIFNGMVDEIVSEVGALSQHMPDILCFPLPYIDLPLLPHFHRCQRYLRHHLEAITSARRTSTSASAKYRRLVRVDQKGLDCCYCARCAVRPIVALTSLPCDVLMYRTIICFIQGSSCRSISHP